MAWGRGSGVLLVAAAWLPGTAFGQTLPSPPPSSADIDPSAPLDPLPDLEVDWPDPLREPQDAPPTAAPAPGIEVPAEPPAELLAEEQAERPYTVAVTGLDALEGAVIQKAFRETSALEADRRRRANAATLERRARADADLLVELLRSRGFYDARVEPQVERASGTVNVTLAAEPGALYRFAEVRLPGLEGAGEDAAKLRDSFAVKPGDPVIAQQVIDAGIALQVALGRQGFALAKVGEQDIEINHETRTATLVLPIDPGAFQRFGAVRVTGEPPLGSDHVQRIARFDPGERYRQDRVDDLRRALLATGLVAAAEVTTVPRADGRTVDLNVKLTPAPARTIAGELGYGTGEGLRAEASWQHRNFFNPEGALTLRGVLGTQEQLIGSSIRWNNWRRRDQVLLLQASASNVDRDAYEARTVQIGAGIERQSNFLWQKKWTWSIGAEVLASSERDGLSPRIVNGEPQRQTFFIGALSASLTYDGSDDLLDPSRGFRLGGRLSPEISRQGSNTATYLKAQLDGSLYRPVARNVVAAGRVRLGAAFGASRNDIAPSRRFYAGGGGSVRGYGFQRLGPLDADNDPIGGRGLAEFSVEARVRFGNFGVVPFIDAGNLTDESLPDFKDWQVGVGIGGRYYSSFGPIRIDVGTPLKRRQGDSRIAVTVSLGQAF